MLKKLLFIPILAMFMFVGVASAQTEEIVQKPGLTPESTWYFLDRLGENLQEFFTFNKEAKAKLQIKFANERIAEIKILVETKGPETKGIEKAKALLIGNVAHAAEIVQKVKASGKDVAKLAKELDDQFDAQEQLLIDTFQEARKKLSEGRLLAVQNLIDQAQQLGDLEEVAGLKIQAQALVSENKALKEKKDEIKESFRREKKKIEEELDDEDQKEDGEEEALHDEVEKLEDEVLDEEEEEDEQEEADEEDEDNESEREQTKKDAEEIQEALEKALENSNLTETEREAIKQAGEKAREDAKQEAEESDEDDGEEENDNNGVGNTVPIIPGAGI